jgi:hypothetical protein
MGLTVILEEDQVAHHNLMSAPPLRHRELAAESERRRRRAMPIAASSSTDGRSDALSNWPPCSGTSADPGWSPTLFQLKRAAQRIA